MRKQFLTLFLLCGAAAQDRLPEIPADKLTAKFGEQGVIDMAGTNGYYDFLAMTMNAAQTAPDRSKPMLPALSKH